MAKHTQPTAETTYRIYDDPQRPGRKIVQLYLGHGEYVRRRAANAQAAEKIGQELVERQREKLNVKVGALTLQAFVNIWWDKAIKHKDLAPKTKADYRDTLERYVLPTWGTHRIDEFDAPLLIDMFAQISEQYTAQIAHRSLTKLHMVFDAARRWKYIRDNPVADARKDVPARSVSEKRPLTAPEVQQLLRASAAHRHGVLYLLMVTLGTRLGETLGLQWLDVDWDANTIQIRRQVQEIHGKISLREQTKTKAGTRTLPLPPHLRSQLWELHERRGEAAFIFTNDEGRMLSPSLFSRHFRGGRVGRLNKDGTDKRIEGMRQKANLPSYVTPHTLRHTVATRLKELGISEEIRADILGHGNTSITQHYSHTVLAPMREALEALERAILSEK